MCTKTLWAYINGRGTVSKMIMRPLLKGRAISLPNLERFFYKDDVKGLFHGCEKCMIIGGEYTEKEKSVG